MRRIPVLILIGTLLAIFFTSQLAAAQGLSFRVDREVIDVYWESDGTVQVVYEISFINEDFGAPIDYVDIGLPTSSYSISNVTAWVDGRPILDITPSPYVDPGVALGLGSNTIPPGGRGVVQMQASGIGNVLYFGDESGYASALFAVNWFGSEFVSGTTDMTLRYHLPPGIQSEEPRWHASPDGWPEEAPATNLDSDGRVLYTWYNPAADPSEAYVFGASFPVDYVPEEIIQTPTLRQRLGISEDTLIMLGCAGGVGLMIFFFIWIGVAADRRRKLDYLPPKIAIEGHGIKRGLTAVEAAILLETKLDKVLSMILFSLVKKGAAKVVTEEPLKVEALAPAPKDLRVYETDFLEALGKANKRDREKSLQKMMVTLVKSVQKKMKGFSLRETRAYYRQIIKKAWKQVEEAKTPEVRSELYAQDLEWTMLDRKFEDRTQEVFRTGPVILPGWWHAYRPMPSATTAGPSIGRSTTSAGPAGKIGLPTLPGSTFAATIVQGVQNTAGNLVTSLTSFTGGITKTTNPPPPPSTTRSSSRSSRSGGSSCACACACACAGCACACAGGGR